MICKIYHLKGLKPKNKGGTNLYECCDLTKKVYLMLNLSLQSVIPSELSDNLKVYEFELTEYEVETIYTLNKNMRKIVPIVKLKSGEVILRDGKSRHYPFTFEEPLDRVNPHYIE